MRHWVFAYGSNMDLKDLERWCRERERPLGHVDHAEAAVLPNHALAWNYYSDARKGGAANVEQRAGAELWGLALLVCPTALRVIDDKEGHPRRYRRGPRPVPARLRSGGEVAAWVYVVREEFRRQEQVPPTRHYRDIMLRAARAHGFPEHYLRELERLPTRD